MDNTSARPPLVTRKMLIRTVLGLFSLAALLFGYQWFKSLGGDLDLPFNVETVGLIAAIQETSDGNQVVLIQPDGKILPSPGYVAGASDRDVEWRPDGNRVFFSSDREERVYNIFRWNPGSEKVERRTFGSRAKTTIEFPSEAVDMANDRALITSGGFVLELNPTNGETPQILPPVGREISASGEGGSASQFDAVYEKLGSSFRRAKWAANGRDWIATVMRRDVGEVLVLQSMVSDGPPSPPFPIVAGERVEFDINPKTGEIVFVSIGFQFPDRESIPKEFIVNGRIKRPFTNLVGVIDPNKLDVRNDPIAASNSDDIAFSSPTISPDGTSLVLLTGKHVGSGQVEAQNIVVMPARPNGGKDASRVYPGTASDPSWAPDSERILFVHTDKGKRAIFEARKDGSSIKNLTGQTGDFSRPIYSPQVKR